MKTETEVTPTKQVYIVDGAYRDDRENGSTSDYVVAISEDDAEQLAQKVRDVTGDTWVCDAVTSVVEQIKRYQDILAEPLARVESYLEDTLENLGGARCTKCEVVYLACDAGEEDGLCPSCVDAIKEK